MSLASPDTFHLDSYENASQQHDKGEGEGREPQEVEQPRSIIYQRPKIIWFS